MRGESDFMTVDELLQLIGAHPAHSIRADGTPTADWVQAIEARSNSNPADRNVARAVHEVARWASAAQGLPVVVGGVRREQLLRWDDWTTTWIGVDEDRGDQALVRVLRPWAASDPILRRQIEREARVLGGIVPGLIHFAGAQTGLQASLLGTPMTVTATPAQAEDDVLHTRLLATAMVAMARWEEQGLRLPALTRDEVRNCGDRVEIACLSPCDRGDHGALLSHLSGLLGHHDGSRLGALRNALIQAPPASAADAQRYAIAAMAEHLAGRRHALFSRHARGQHTDRLVRLLTLTRRLAASLSPPRGLGALGVDLEGEIQVVRSDGTEVCWGPRGATKAVYSAAEGFVAPEARRMLRARAAAPTSARLQAEVQGDATFTRAIGQWTAAALKLRTVRLLLEKAL